MKFREEVEVLVEQIPRGMVSTYGEIAAAMGDNAASTTVYNILLEGVNNKAPVHRVVTAKGESPYSRHAQLLIDEGIQIRNKRVQNLGDYMFRDFKSNRILLKLKEEQERLAKQVILEDSFNSVEKLGGVDVSYRGDYGYAACVILDSKNMRVIEERRTSGKVSFPYISTYLSYRELPLINKIFARVKEKPDILMIDGNGILHPRRMGIASHAGIVLDIPTIGVAKRLLLGRLAKVPQKIGEFSGIMHNGSVVGMALRTTKSSEYIYISPGHKISMRSSLEWSKKFCFHKAPEPIRRAHRIATELRNKGTK